MSIPMLLTFTIYLAKKKKINTSSSNKHIKIDETRNIYY